MINRKVAALAGAASIALVLSACAESGRDVTEPGEEIEAEVDGEANPDATFVFGAAGEPVHFDPFYASDGETFRITRQIYEQLLDFEPGTAEVTGGLATEWDSTDDGLEWTFQIREGVQFHDGTDLDAEAICANFERWYNQTGDAQNSAVTYYWNNNFGGFADQPDRESIYESCEVTGDYEIVVTITRYTSKFPDILAHNAYAIHSPTALEEYDADNVVAEGGGFVFPAYTTEHPTGTGPFQLGSYDSATSIVTLERFDDYWGEVAGVAEMVVRPIPDEATRRQELEAGTIHGYDLPNPVDWQTLIDADNSVAIRDPFNILYVGLNPGANEALLDLDVRMALSHAINRDQLVSTQLPDESEAASHFFPSSLPGYNEDLEPHAYDPDLARELLEGAGYAEGELTIEFWLPTEVTRPYMPDPERIFNAIRDDWEAVGVVVEQRSLPWAGGYLDGALGGEASAFLLGWTGDYSSPDNFVGTFFGAANEDDEFSTARYDWGQDLADALVEADSEPDDDTRAELYQEINRAILEDYVPALPISHSPPAIVVGPNVAGLVTSPLANEDFSTVTIIE